MQSHCSSEFCANLTYHESDPTQAVYPTLKRLHGKIWPRLGGLPALADRATGLGGSPHLSCKMRLKWEIIWTGGLPHLSELPHLPGVPHLHVNRPLSNDDGDGNEKGKNATGWRKNNFARFFVHCTLTTTWKCLISCFVEDVNIRQRLSFPFPELLCHLLEFNSRIICQYLMNWARWNKRD